MGKLKVKERYVKFLIYLAVVILINIAGITLFFRWDLTQDKKYSLSKVSRDVVSTLSEPLTIKVFFSRNLPAPHNNTERYLRDLLEEYAVTGKKYFNFKFYNVNDEKGTFSETEQNRKMANDYGIHPVQIQTLENDELKFKKAYMGLAIIHGDMVETIDSITSIEGLEYKLTTAIQKLNNKVSALLNLEGNIKVNLYLSSALDVIAPYVGLEGLTEMPERLKQAIDDLNEQSLGKIAFNVIDPTESENQETLSEKYNLMNFKWPEISEKNVPEGSGIAGIVMAYKEKTKTIQVIDRIEIPIVGTTYQMRSPAALSEKITKTMESMIGINQEIGYLSDHGTPSLFPTGPGMMQQGRTAPLNIFNQLISERYAVTEIPLSKKTIPEGLKSLLMVRPTEKFTQYELFQIDQALMRGTNIAFFTDAFNEIIPENGRQFGMAPQYEPINTGLEKLLSHWGVNIKNAFVLDTNCSEQSIPQRQGGGTQKIFFIPILEGPGINHAPRYMNNIKGLVTMKISPLELVEKNIDKEHIKITRLLSSSDRSWLMEDRINLNPMFMRPPEAEDQMESYPLAYVLEGRFTSFFKGKEIPEKIVEQAAEQETGENQNQVSITGLTTEHAIIEKGESAKILILPSSSMLTDQMLDREGKTTNSTFILNIIDHLNGEDRIAVMRSKTQGFNPLHETTALIKGFVKTFNIVMLPALVALFGLGVWFRRASRKRKIQTLFQKAEEEENR